MDTLKNLRQIITRISKEELYFFMNGISDTSEKLKSKKAMELIVSEQSFSANEIQKVLYGRINYHAFNKLLNRLKSKLLESLISDQNIVRKGLYSKRNLENIKLRKELIQADILQLKGERNEAESLYKSIIKRSLENEMYDIEMQASYGYQRLLFNNKNINKIHSLNDKIKSAEKCWILLNQSQTTFNDIMNLISVSSSYLKYSDRLADAIITLEKNFHITKSNLIKYYLLILEAEKWQNIGLYINASNCFFEIESLINCKSVYTLNRLGSLKINISNNYLYLNQFDLCIKYALESAEIYKNIPVTLNIVNEILFYAHFYISDYNSCNDILDKISSNRAGQTLSISNKLIYYKSCLLFLRKDYVSTISSLNQLKEMLKDSEGLNINIRLLKLMCMLELKYHEDFELELQNMEQFLKRNRKFIRKRYFLILKILHAIQKHNYDFRTISIKINKHLKELNAKEEEVIWRVKSTELINFQDWLLRKL